MRQAAVHSPLLIKEIGLQSILSFGPETPSLELKSLNLLVGPNGSGKSNLIETICLLRSSPVDMQTITRQGGGVREWIWKGTPDASASVSATLSNAQGKYPLRHRLDFRADNQVFRLIDERIENEDASESEGDPVSYYQYKQGYSILKTGNIQATTAGIGVDLNTSILAQRRDPEHYPEITYLAEQYGKIRVYREWQFGRSTVFRAPQRADMRSDQLEEDFSNLSLFLNRLRRDPKTKKVLLNNLRDIYEGLDDFDISVEGGTVQVFFTEGEFTVPATRLSDGTLRYLCLLAILCDPAPPPLICIEEPELGLHPDILPRIADLLVDASTRTQLIVTTHSDILVDAMTERPEVVLVCEKHEGQTQMTRLSKEDLAIWLEKYRLGELWTRGELGGTRW